MITAFKVLLFLVCFQTLCSGKPTKRVSLSDSLAVILFYTVFVQPFLYAEDHAEQRMLAK